MSATGKQYQLYQDAYIDERLDPYKATEAACHYLKDLYQRFGNWYWYWPLITADPAMSVKPFVVPATRPVFGK